MSVILSLIDTPEDSFKEIFLNMCSKLNLSNGKETKCNVFSRTWLNRKLILCKTAKSLTSTAVPSFKYCQNMENDKKVMGDKGSKVTKTTVLGPHKL